MSVYSKVPIIKPGRNKFNGLSHNFRNTINIGEIHLSCRPIEMVPGDTMDFSQVSSLELQPLVHPFKGDLYYESWAFFVSNRICQYDNVYEPEELTNESEFEEILLDSANNAKSLPIPILENTNPAYGSNGDIPSYLSETGFTQYGLYQSSIEKFKLCSYPFRGIDLIFKEYFRDENLQPVEDIIWKAGRHNLIDGEDLYYGFYNINYKKDRFTGASTSPQKGRPVFMPLTGIAPLKQNNFTSPWFYKYSSDSSPLSIAGNVVDAEGAGPAFITNNDITDTQLDNAEHNIRDVIESNFSVDLSSGAAGFYIENLRLANKLQRWNERNMLTGTRAKEYYLSNYGVAPSDETLQRPAMIGHIKTPVIINSVLQHEEAEDTPLGYKAGNGGAIQATHFGRWTAKEFGWVLILSALRPRATYQNQIDRSLIKTSVWDFFNKIFEGLGQEEIYNCEVDSYNVNVNDNIEPGTGPLDVFGYTDRYNYMREMQDLTTGQLIQDNTPQSLPSYVVVRKFSDYPSLSEEFIQVKPSEYDYLFAVPHDSLNHAIVSTFNKITAYRPLSKYAHPSLA